MLLENKLIALHLVKHIDTTIGKKLALLSRMVPKDAASDLANTWLLRGHIAALEQLKRELLDDENKE